MTAPTAAPVAAPPAAVLWDMDGTLVDTEPYWMECEHELVTAFGGRWTEEDARSIIGFDLLDAAVVLRERGGVDLEPREIVERLLDGVIARVRGARAVAARRPPAAVRAQRPGRPVRARHDVVAAARRRHRRGARADHVPGHRHRRQRRARQAAPRAVPAGRRRARRRPASSAWPSRTPRPACESATAAGCVVVAVPNMVEIAAGARTDHRAQPQGRPGRRPRRLRRGDAAAGGAGPAAHRPTRDQARRRALHRRRRRRSPSSCSPSSPSAPSAGGDDAPPRQPGALNVHAWAPYWVLDDALPALEAHADTLHELSPFWYRATGVDTIEIEANTPTEQAEQFLDLARERDVPLVASILDGTDAGVMAGILADPAQRAAPRRRHRRVRRRRRLRRHRHRLRAVRVRRRPGLVGGDHGRTGSPSSASWPSACDADGRTLAVSIPPVYDAGQTDDSGYWVYDYAAIAPLVDSIRVMAYDYSVASGPPGPIAPLPWVDQVIAGTERRVRGPVEARARASRCTGATGSSARRARARRRPRATSASRCATSRTSSCGAARRRCSTPTTHEWSFTYDLVVERRHDVVHAAARGALRRRRRRPDPHAARRRRRVRRRVAVRPRLRGRRRVVGHRHHRRPAGAGHGVVAATTAAP